MSRRPYNPEDYDNEHYAADHVRMAVVVFVIGGIGYGIYKLFEWLF